MNQDEQEKLNRLLDRLPKGDYPLDQWLAEDETATYDALVAERRRRLIVSKTCRMTTGIWALTRLTPPSPPLPPAS